MSVRKLFVVILILSSCIDPVEVPILYSEPALVVDGMLTNEPGPQTVRLYWSSRQNEILSKPNLVKGATVRIKNDTDGTITALTEVATGVYQVNAFNGEVGKAYSLVVTLPGDEVYESVSQVMKPAGQLQRLYFEYKPNEINPNNLSLPQDAVVVYADAVGDPSTTNLIRWRSTGVFHIKTNPELRTRWVQSGRDAIEVPDPEPCSGYVAQGFSIVQEEPCTCCDCWITRYHNEVVMSRGFASDEKFNKVMVVKLPLEEWVFDDRYYLEVEQLNLSEEVYDFWKLVESQKEASSNIFQPNISRVKGNMTCTSNSSKRVLGVFSVNAVSRQTIFIGPEDLVGLVPLHDVRKADCRKYYDNASTQRPDFW